MLFVDLFLWQTSVIHISNEGNFSRILLLQELEILNTLHRYWSRPLTVHTGMGMLFNLPLRAFYGQTHGFTICFFLSET